MSLLNNFVMLMGRLGKDPEVKTTQSGQNVTTMSIATEKSWKVNDEWKKRTDWHRVVGWNKVAERMAEAKKGDLVMVQGELQTRSWEDKEGNKKQITEVLAGAVVMMTGEKKPAARDPGDEPRNHTEEEDVPF